MVQHLVGVYPTIDKAIQTLHDLKARGYDRHHVTVLANRDVVKRLPWNVDGDVEVAEVSVEDKKGFFDSIKELFVSTEEEYEQHHSNELLDIRKKYLQELKDGQIVVLLNEEAHKTHENENELDTSRSPLSTVPALDYETENYPSSENNQTNQDN